MKILVVRRMTSRLTNSYPAAVLVVPDKRISVYFERCKRAEGCIVSKLVATNTRSKIQRTPQEDLRIDLLEDDTGYAVDEVENSMKDRHFWRAIINAQQQESTE